MNTRGIVVLALLLALSWLAGATAQAALLDEDFNDGVANDFTTYDDAWWVEYGVYRCHTVGNSVFSFATAGDLTWTDYHLALDIMSFGSTAHLIYFRTQDVLNSYSVDLRSAPYNDVHLELRTNGDREDLAVASFPNENGEWHHFDIEVIGKDITVRADGELLFFVHHADAPWENGGIALVSFSGGVIQEQQLYVDNVLVTAMVVGTEATSWSSIKALYQ